MLSRAATTYSHSVSSSIKALAALLSDYGSLGQAKTFIHRGLRREVMHDKGRYGALRSNHETSCQNIILMRIVLEPIAGLVGTCMEAR